MSIIIPLCISHCISQIIQTHYKINYWLLMTFAWINIFICIEYKLSPTHYNITDKDDLQRALDRSSTGDFIFMRGYHTLDIGDMMISRGVASIINGAPFFSHIGMIVKINGVAHVLENAMAEYHCVHANKIKSGVKLTNACNMINTYHGKAYLFRNNLHNYVRDEDISPFMDKYGHLLFLENNMICVTTICMFLQFVNAFKPGTNFMNINEFNNPELYTCDFKNVETVELKNKYYYDTIKPTYNEKSIAS
jgi:hypothetical protein